MNRQGVESRSAQPIVSSAISPWLACVLAIAVTALLAGGLWWYRVEKYALLSEAENNLRAVAALKIEQIAAWRADRVGDASVIAESPYLREAVLDWMNAPAEEKTAIMAQRLEILRTYYHYYDVLVLDTEGNPLLSLRERSVQLHPEVFAIASEAIAQGKPVFGELHRDEDGIPHLDLVAPLFRDGTPDRPAIGSVVLQIDARRYLYPMIQSWPTASETAESLLVRRDGDDVLFLNELRNDKRAALELRLPLNMAELPAAMAVNGARGVIEGMDYRGEPVLAVAGGIPDSSWYLIAKVDKREAHAVWRRLSALIVAFIVCVAATLVALFAAILQRNARIHDQATYEAEGARRRSEAILDTAINAVPAPIFFKNCDGVYQGCNQAFSEYVGHPKEFIVGKSAFEITTPDLAQQYLTADQELLTTHGIQSYEAKVMRADGAMREVLFQKSTFAGADGLTAGIIGVMLDITERKEAELALVDEANRRRILFEQAKDGIVVLDSERKVVEANQSFADMLGYTRDEILRLRVWDWDALYPSEEQFDAQWPQTPSIADVIETRHRRKDGSIFDVEIRSNPAEWAGHYQLYCVCRDITERKRAEAEKERLQAQLVQAQKMESVGRLAGGVAHDFNNALQSILGYAELALDTVQDGDPLQTDLREIRKAAERSAALTRQLLAFARKQTVAPRVLDLNETVSGMIRMLERLIGEDIELVWIPGSGPHPTMIDPSQVDQVLANLAINARDAIAGTGRITIETGIALFDEAYCASHPDCLPGEYVMLAVSDTGCGMDKETLTNVFDPFFTTKEMGKGTGLGLATVYGIVRQNNGLINVYSEVNRGTTFRIYLQRHHTESHEDSGANAASAQPAGELAGAETVLVVEDEETILNLARRILEGLGYRVLAVPKPSDALQMVRAGSVKVDLLITDVVMPEMDGRNLANQLDAIVPGLKSLYMSGYTANVIAHHGVLDEGVHFLQKPFSARELAERVRNALDS